MGFSELVNQQVDPNGKRKKMNKFKLEKQSSAKSEETDSLLLILRLCYKLCSRELQCFSFFFSIPSSWKVSYIIQLPLNHPNPTLVDHLSSHLSAYPIRHPLWSLVSYGSQYNNVQGSSPHKCGQKSSCNAFNAVVAAFHQIFLGFLHPYAFMMHVLITGASWKVTLIVGIHI